MKAIGWLIGILLLVVVGLGVYVVMNSGGLIKTAVETYGPKYLGVERADVDRVPAPVLVVVLVVLSPVPVLARIQAGEPRHQGGSFIWG